MAKLNARFVETAKPGKYGDASTKGLQLVVAPTGARKWVLRFMSQGKAREMGLAVPRSWTGPCAREGAGGSQARQGWRRPHRRPAAGSRRSDVRRAGRRGRRRTEQGLPERQAQGAMGDDLDRICRPAACQAGRQGRDSRRPRGPQADLVREAETASRVRGRIERVLNAAKAKGFRTGENPAAWRGHLENLLPKQSKLSRGHFAALPYADVPAFLAKLREREAVAALALEFAILTAARSGEVLNARWEEIDFDTKVWAIPAPRTKSGREHRVPLSDPATMVLAKLSAAKVSEFVFPGQRPHRPLSNMSMEMVLRRMGVADDITTHGFRSSFRDWAGNGRIFRESLRNTPWRT